MQGTGAVVRCAACSSVAPASSPVAGALALWSLRPPLAAAAAAPQAALKFAGSAIDVISHHGSAMRVTSLNAKGSWYRVYDTEREVTQQNAEGVRCKTTAWWDGEPALWWAVRRWSSSRRTALHRVVPRIEKLGAFWQWCLSGVWCLKAGEGCLVWPCILRVHCQ